MMATHSAARRWQTFLSLSELDGGDGSPRRVTVDCSTIRSSMPGVLLGIPSFLSLKPRRICKTSIARPLHRWSGRRHSIGSAKAWCSAASTGRWVTVEVGGYLPRKLSPRQLCSGRIGLGTNAPPQLGHTLRSTLVTQQAQNVHSNVQIRASNECGGRGSLQFSQAGLS